MNSNGAQSNLMKKRNLTIIGELANKFGELVSIQFALIQLHSIAGN